MSGHDLVDPFLVLRPTCGKLTLTRIPVMFPLSDEMSNVDILHVEPIPV